eukprot:scaffold79458_cov54-Phaeocystis_antarctica.AAC.4
MAHVGMRVVGYRLGPVALNIWWIAHVPRVIPQQPSSVARGEALGADSIKDGAQIAPAQATPHTPSAPPARGPTVNPTPLFQL